MKKLLIILILLLPAQLYAVQQDTLQYNYSSFLRFVLENNLEYLMEQHQVSAAEAALTASRIFEDPELEIILPNFDREDFKGAPSNIAFELEIPIETAGKRKNRIRHATAELEHSKAGLEDFLRVIRSEAASLFVEVLHQQLVIEQMRTTYSQLEELLSINRELFAAGEISEIDVLHTRLEARNFRAELLDEESELESLMEEVYIIMGRFPTQTIIFTGSLQSEQPSIDYNELLSYALQNRPDLAMASSRIRAEEALLNLARAERVPDVGIILGYHNEEGIKPMPGFRTAYAGVRIPIKFSAMNSGSVREARAMVQHAQKENELIALKVQSEVNTAWRKYDLANRKKQLYTETILLDAERVRDAVVYSYQRGEVSLLEMLEAQRTFNETYLNYYHALSENIQALIRLSEASGVWLIEHIH